MAVTRGRSSGSTQTESTTFADILPASYGGCEELVIKCDEASTATLKVAVQCRAGNADSPHLFASASAPTDWAELKQGESIPFAGSLDNKITKVMVAGNGGTATLWWTVTKS